MTDNEDTDESADERNISELTTRLELLHEENWWRREDYARAHRTVNSGKTRSAKRQ